MRTAKTPIHACIMLIALVACSSQPAAPLRPAEVEPQEPTLLTYTPAELSGLKPVAPYPTPDDVCQRLADNDVTIPLRSEGRDLIGCPKHEKGAIADRRGEGGLVVANAAHWVVLSMPAP